MANFADCLSFAKYNPPKFSKLCTMIHLVLVSPKFNTSKFIWRLICQSLTPPKFSAIRYVAKHYNYIIVYYTTHIYNKPYLRQTFFTSSLILCCVSYMTISLHKCISSHDKFIAISKQMTLLS